MLLYSVVPEYRNEWYYNFYCFFEVMLIPLIAGGWVYITEFDPLLADPHDGLWHFGAMLAGRWRDADKRVAGRYIRPVLIRAYFIPVTIVCLVGCTGQLLTGPDYNVATYMANAGHPYDAQILKLLLVIYAFFTVMDTAFGSVGYLLCFRVLDTDVRSTDPTFLGWFICLICYHPFFEILVMPLFLSDLFKNPQWYLWMPGHPLLIVVWGTLTIVAMCFESGTTLTFGARFSNLTYRRIVTTGPYRYTRHPAYVAKMFNRFFFFVPFLSHRGVAGAAQMMLMFCGLCYIYYLRAKTEENHLSRYPEYVEYAEAMNQRSVFGFVGRLCPPLRFTRTSAASVGPL